MSRNILKIPFILIPISRPCYVLHSFVWNTGCMFFFLLDLLFAKCALVCHPNKSICRNICPALLTLTLKLAFCPQQMFGICPFPQNFPKSAQFSHLTGTMISRPRPLVQSTHGPRFWSNKVEDFFRQSVFAQIWLNEKWQSNVVNVCFHCHLEKW